MDETSQIQPPPSFAALYADRHGRLKASIADVVGRYELCEDLASHLVEQAQTLYHSGNSSEQGVLLGMHAGLAAEGSIVSPGEARWIVQRLAELLEWQAPLLPDASPLPAPKAQPEGHHRGAQARYTARHACHLCLHMPRRCRVPVPGQSLQTPARLTGAEVPSR